MVGIRVLTAFVTISMSTAAATGVAAAAPHERPNIVLIQTDDEPASMLDPAVMPLTLDAFSDGVRFDNYIVTTSQCCPSRATLLTGQYPHNSGVTSNIPGYPALREKANTLATWLQKAGYNTAHIGKYMNGYESSKGSAVAPGWSEWRTMLRGAYFGYSLSHNGRFVRYGTADDDYLTRVLNGFAVDLIRNLAPRKKPFYLQLDEFAPHVGAGRGSGDCGQTAISAVPDPRDEARYAGAALPTGPAYNEDDVSDKPSYIQARRQFVPAQFDEITRQYRCALGSIPAVDRGVARVFAALRATSSLRNTVVIFTSDNGYQYGEHRVPVGKGLPYEESLRVPLLVRMPHRPIYAATRSTSLNATVANLDIAPTLLQLAGAEPCIGPDRCRRLDGRSFVRLLKDRHPAWASNRAIVASFDINLPSYGFSCRYDGLRTATSIYIEHQLLPSGASRTCTPSTETELYDLSADPFELANVSNTGDPRQASMAALLASIRDCSGIKGRDAPPPSGVAYCR